jgi:hypothetical protein
MQQSNNEKAREQIPICCHDEFLPTRLEKFRQRRLQLMSLIMMASGGFDGLDFGFGFGFVLSNGGKMESDVFMSTDTSIF